MNTVRHTVGNTVRALSLAAALGVAGTAAVAQTSPEPASAQANSSSENTQSSTPAQQATSPSSASSPHQRDVTSQQVPEATPNENADPNGASSPHQHLATADSGAVVSSGMMVQDRSGQSLGSVGNVIPAKSGHRGYVMVNGTDGSATPVPYSIASSMAKNGMIVLDRATFEGAPKVQQNELEHPAGTAWQNKADRYWSKHTG
jgi:Tfp pilus assembly protein FimT